MLFNYLNTALRSLLKNKGYSTVNLMGLVLGITACILSCLYVQHELSYDSFHSQSDQIFRVQNKFTPPVGNNSYPHTVSALAPAVASVSDNILDFVRLTKAAGGGFNNTIIVKIEDELYREVNVYAADPTFFNFFEFRLIQGNSSTVLDQPYQIVLTEKVALKFFKKTDVVGKTLQFTHLPNKEFIVSGVMQDLPSNTHLNTELLISMSTIDAIRPEGAGTVDQAWLNDGFYTYFFLQDKEQVQKVEALLQQTSEENVEDINLGRFNASLMPLEDIHLHSQALNEMKANGSLDQVVIFISVAAFVLLIAIINYMNLSTARSARRAREVGMRKALGASRKQLVFQFLGESTLLSIVATFLSVFLAMLLLPYFNQATDGSLQIDIFANGNLIILLFGITLTVGLISGSYPALFLSSFKPTEVLKGKLTAGMKSSPIFRTTLVVFQFAVSIILISCTWIVFQQLSYLKNKDLGFQRDNILVVKNTNNAVTDRLEAFKRELMGAKSIENVSASFSSPGGLRPIAPIKTLAMNEEEKVNMALINVDFEYIPTLKIDVVQGRNFDPKLTTDSTESIILNKSAAAELGLAENPIDKVVLVSDFNGGYTEKKVIGLIDDINFEPLYRATEPAYLSYQFPFFNYLFIGISSNDQQQSIQHLEKTWNLFVDGQPLEYAYLNDNLNQLYLAEDRMGKLISGFSLLAVFVACLGLFGLASYATDQRSKEIGLRKVLGASISGIIALFFKEYIKIIIIANLISWPIVWWVANSWMSHFTFHTTISPIILVVTGIIVLFIALLTVGSRAFSAAQVNPMKSIRND